MLQQHAAVGVEREQPRGAEPTPVPLPGRRDHPRVAGIARAERTARLAGCGRLDRHLAHPVTRACHELADRTAASADTSERRAEEYEDGDDDYELDDDPARIPRDAVWAWLSTEAYWGRWRTRADIEAQLDSAWRVVGAYRAGTGRAGRLRPRRVGRRRASPTSPTCSSLAEHRGTGSASA